MTETTHNTSYLVLAQLIEGTNIAKRKPDPALVASIHENGILQPLLVRPGPGGKFEVVCGHRRLMAALELKLASVPVLVREMTDAEAIAAQIVENDQREDAHPLDQAHGYAQLVGKSRASGHLIADVAAKVGRPEKYVYDRLRLLELTKNSQALFRQGTIQLGHAIVLARLKPEDQARTIAADDALFTREHVLELEAEDESGPDVPHVKTRTVRELQGWIDEHVRFDVAAADLPQLFPETATEIACATEAARKVIPITHEYHVADDAKSGEERTFGPMSWRRADGKHKSKTCERSVLGVIVAGVGRGESMQVCVDRKKCAVHFGAEIRKAQRTASLKGKPVAGGAKATSAERRAAASAAKCRELQARANAERVRWQKASPEIYKLVALAVVKGGKPKATGAIADALVKECQGYQMPKSALDLVPRGKTAEDLIRYLTYLTLSANISDYSAATHQPRELKKYGINVAPVLAKFPLELKTTATEGDDGNDEE